MRFDSEPGRAPPATAADRGASETPARYRDRGGCGTILIWTRAGRANGGRLNWKRVSLGVALIFGMVLLSR